MLKIVTFKWDAGLHPKKQLKFADAHVRMLKTMLDRYLDIDFEFICITDETTKKTVLDDGTVLLPMWSWGREYPGCFRRLKLFSPEMREFIGERFVMMDLDVIITNNITHLFTRNEDFVIWGDRPMRNPYCGSLMMMTAGARKEVWDTFDINDYPPHINGRYPLGTDQNHIHKTIPNEATWTIEDGVYNFGFDIRINDKILRVADSRRKGLKGMDYYLKVVKNPKTRGGTGEFPADSKLIFFNGKDDPSQPKLRERYPWIKEYWG